MEKKYKYIILHGCPPSEDMVIAHENRWMNWLADKLNAAGYAAIAPDMPESWKPKYLEWKTEFEKYPIDANTVFIGHSCGAAFMVRWLLETGTTVNKLILVAPAKVPESDQDPRMDLYNFEIPPKMPVIAGDTVLFTSNDLPHHLESLELYKKALNPRVIRLEGKVHFLFFQMKSNQFPELLQEVLNPN